MACGETQGMDVRIGGAFTCPSPVWREWPAPACDHPAEALPHCPFRPVPSPPHHLWVRFEKMGFVVQGIQTVGKAGR